MSVLVISAVDHTTNQITITGHGKVTGDGPVDIRALEGGTLPGNLSPLTDYWLIRVDDDTVKLADSSALALLGTARDITSNGTGTRHIRIGIPYRRARTYVPKSVDVAGSQVKSADLNAIQDALWDHEDRIATLEDWQSGDVAIDGDLDAEDITADSVTASGRVEGATLGFTTARTRVIAGRIAVDMTDAHTPLSTGYQLETTGDVVYFIPTESGELMVSWAVAVRKLSDGDQTISAYLQRVAADGTATQVGATQSNNANAPGLISLGQTLAHAVVAGSSYEIVVSGSNTGAFDAATDDVRQAAFNYTR